MWQVLPSAGDKNPQNFALSASCTLSEYFPSSLFIYLSLTSRSRKRQLNAKDRINRMRLHDQLTRSQSLQEWSIWRFFILYPSSSKESADGATCESYDDDSSYGCGQYADDNGVVLTAACLATFTARFFTHHLQQAILTSAQQAWNRPRVGPGSLFPPFSSLVHSLPHPLLFFTFPPFLFSFALPIFFFCPPLPFLPKSSHSVSRPEVVVGDRTWI